MPFVKIDIDLFFSKQNIQFMEEGIIITALGAFAQVILNSGLKEGETNQAGRSIRLSGDRKPRKSTHLFFKYVSNKLLIFYLIFFKISRTQNIIKLKAFAKLRDTVRAFRSSPHLFTSLQNTCDGMEAKHKPIPLYNETRWSSSFKMLQRAIELKDCVLYGLENDYEISEDDWNELQDLQLCPQVFNDLSVYRGILE